MKIDKEMIKKIKKSVKDNFLKLDFIANTYPILYPKDRSSNVREFVTNYSREASLKTFEDEKKEDDSDVEETEDLLTDFL